MNIRTELLEMLERELRALQVRTYRAADAGELRETLAGICRPYDRSAVACEDRPFLKELDLGFPVFSACEKDTWRAELRGEFFNLFNNTNFNLPGHSVGAPTFGLVNSAKAARSVQLAFRIDF